MFGLFKKKSAIDSRKAELRLQPRESALVEVNGGVLTYRPDENVDAVPLLKTVGKTREFSMELSDDAKYLIAAKISRLLPDLVKTRKIELLEYTLGVLRVLCRDQVTRVRRIIAEELKDSEDAPHELISMLAWDEDIGVASPILEFSPVLTDDDLVEIIMAAKLDDVCEAVSRRKKISIQVSKTIVDKGSNAAVTMLLKNSGAMLSEDSLEQIAVNAEQNEVWQQPLLSRPELSIRVINKVAAYVSEAMINGLEQSGKIKSDMATLVRKSVKERLESPTHDAKVKSKIRATEMYNLDMLSAAEVADAVDSGNREFVVQGIAKLSGFSADSVERILRSKNPTAVTAIAWKAGLSMRTATLLQLKISAIHHAEVIHPKGGSDYPIMPEKMQNMLGLFAD